MKLRHAAKPGLCPYPYPFMRSFTCILVVCLCGFLISSSGAQVLSKTPAADASSFAERGISLAEKGRCREALPLLKKAGHVADKQLKYKALMSSARCAMSLDQTETAVEALLVLNREFPRDPEVLYTTTHFYSELASRASQELAATAPTSAQAEELEAEAFESQGNWDKAAAQYKKILEQDPGAPGIHYRLGRISLSASPPQPDEAKKEFEQELKTDPNNASAEFMLGEGSRHTNFTVDHMNDQLSSYAKVEASIIHQRAVLDSYENGKKIGLILDEWGVWDNISEEDEKRFGKLWQQSTMRSAVAAGLGLNIFNRQADKLYMCNIAQMVNATRLVRFMTSLFMTSPAMNKASVIVNPTVGK